MSNAYDNAYDFLIIRKKYLINSNRFIFFELKNTSFLLCDFLLGLAFFFKKKKELKKRIAKILIVALPTTYEVRVCV